MKRLACLVLLLAAPGCSHALDKCVADKIIDHAPMRAQQALACGKDLSCQEQLGEESAKALVDDVAECRAELKQASGSPDGGVPILD